MVAGVLDWSPQSKVPAGTVSAWQQLTGGRSDGARKVGRIGARRAAATADLLHRPADGVGRRIARRGGVGVRGIDLGDIRSHDVARISVGVLASPASLSEASASPASASMALVCVARVAGRTSASAASASKVLVSASSVAASASEESSGFVSMSLESDDRESEASRRLESPTSASPAAPGLLVPQAASVRNAHPKFHKFA